MKYLFTILSLLSFTINTLLGVYMAYSIAVIIPKRRTAVIMAFTVGCSLLVFFAIDFFGNFLPQNMLYFFCVHITTIVTLVTGCKVKLWRALAAVCFTFLLLTPSAFAASILMFMATKYELQFTNLFFSRLCFILVPFLLVIPYSLWVIPAIRSIIREDRKELLYLQLILLAFYLYTMSSYVTLKWTPEITALELFFYVVLYVTLSIISVSYWSQKKISKMEIEQREHHLQNDAIRRQLELLTETQNRYRAIRHDQKHILSAILLHVKENETNKITQLVSQSIEEIDETTIISFCQNTTLNMIISDFERRSRQKQITLKVQTDIPAKLCIKELDLTTIFFNALENSLQATEKLTESDTQEKEIFLNCCMNRLTGQMTLSIQNPTLNMVLFDWNGLPVTTNGDGHGYGTKRITEAVERNNGVCQFSLKDNIFTFRAVFLSAIVLETG